MATIDATAARFEEAAERPSEAVMAEPFGCAHGRGGAPAAEFLARIRSLLEEPLAPAL